MILDDILYYRKIQLEKEKSFIGLRAMRSGALESRRKPLNFKKAISEQGLGIISEVKKASPSKGLIAPDFDPVASAINYEKSGACAISVLTEEHYFMGKGEYLREIRLNVDIPILRKDFIFDPYQIYEARVLGADAVLLIAAMLSQAQMNELIGVTRDLGMYALCESHNRRELERCIQAGADIFGINNRDLNTFEVRLETTEELAGLVPKGAVKVSESGLFSANDIKRVQAAGVDAVLMGESLMRDPALLAALRKSI